MRGDLGLRGITAGSHVLHKYAQESHNIFVYWPVKKLNEKSF